MSYLILGTWNNPGDINTLVDAGVTAEQLDEIETTQAKGIGKRLVERVVLTHRHFDHTAGLGELKKRYAPELFAYAELPEGNTKLSDNQPLHLGDGDFNVICTPGHSDDSICLYCETEGVLFTGDTPMIIRTKGGRYPKSLVTSLKRLAELDIQVIYPGHGSPILNQPRQQLLSTLRMIEDCEIIEQ